MSKGRTDYGNGAVKYVIRAKLRANGYVERPDVVGAIFGQTEGLLGDDLDLRRLLKTGRIGRIDVKLRNENGKTVGEIIVPSSLDRVETALVAAALEQVDRIGPCRAEVEVVSIDDIRKEKRERMIRRAREILREMVSEVTPDSSELVQKVKEAVEDVEVEEYKGLPAGPNVEDSDAIIVVEGRADVANLLRCGIKNVIAVEGTNVPEAIVELSKEKTVTAFVDGDRGGELILKELLQVADVDYVAKAPKGKEVEELTRKEIKRALERKVPVEEYLKEIGERPKDKEREKGKKPKPKKRPERRGRPRKKKARPKRGPQERRLLDRLKRLKGTFRAEFLDEGLKPVKEVELDELVEKLKSEDGVRAVVLDGVITRRLVEAAREKGVKYVVGVKEGDLDPEIKKDVKIITMS
ncbi:DNA primase DnaG [Methanopyrus kandleri]|uniref:DNA primase DnaG n=2 Tax=Methanopyrus kandleri TaxID=2320 RepID=DNAG_METKA|nr:DNA primase DnaG [Methanopyrus kandleri]Q8TXP3.1 RecName: Full=DNA primase DnaG [Methanopyrus kandleri AV19]AAM01832.1 Predicted bacterial-type DNA primase [Methanopyrus kandleri AV19]HII70160.1 DNA primase [Methanopyrus kandleri]